MEKKPLRGPLSRVPKSRSEGPEQTLKEGHNHFIIQLLSYLQLHWNPHLLRGSNRLRTTGPSVIPPKPGEACPDTHRRSLRGNGRTPGEEAACGRPHPS